MPQYKQNKKRIDPRYHLIEQAPPRQETKPIVSGKCSKNWEKQKHASNPNAALGYIHAYKKDRGKADAKTRSDLEFKFLDAERELDAYRKNANAKPTNKLAVFALKRVLKLEEKARKEYQFIGECLTFKFS